jgi:hypothetical protein
VKNHALLAFLNIILTKKTLSVRHVFKIANIATWPINVVIVRVIFRYSTILIINRYVNVKIRNFLIEKLVNVKDVQKIVYHAILKEFVRNARFVILLIIKNNVKNV